MQRVVVLIAFMTGCLALPLRAEEPARAFLEALRENGYYDVALEYLTELETSNLVSEEFRGSLSFERAQTLIDSTLELRDADKIEGRFVEAQTLLSEYAANNQSLETNSRTLSYQGNLYYRRAKLYLRQSEDDRMVAAERQALHTKARGMLEQSRTSYQESREFLRRLIDPSSLEAIKIDPEDPASGRKRSELQTMFTQVRIRLPMVAEELADTFPADDPQRLKLLQDAALEYKNVYDDYRRFAAGLRACVFSARCSQKLGNHQQALDLLAEIFVLGNNSVLKPLKKEAYELATDSWNQMDPYPHNEVIKRLEPVVEALNRIEIRDTGWLRIQMELAIAKHAKAAEVKTNGGPSASSDSKSMDRAAAKVLRNVARIPNPYREKARSLLAEWDIPVGDLEDSEAKTMETFDDARQHAKDLIDELEIVVSDSSLIRQQMTTTDEASKPELQTELSELEQQLADKSQASLDVINTALNLADESTVPAEINNLRYLQSYCFFTTQQYYESALIGEYMVAKYPTIDGTRQAMSLVIRSYSRLLDAAPESDRAFERERLAHACREAIQRWPGASVAGEGARTMTQMALIDDQYDEAEKYFLQIPEDAGYRNVIAVRLGQKMFGQYKAQSRAGTADPAKLKTQLENARTYMAQGVRNASIDTLDYEVAVGALMLVDAYLETGEVDQAIEQLESAPVAPLDLVKRKHPAVTNPAIAELYSRETYKTAIKVYLAAMDQGSDQQQWIDKANGVISAMRQEMEASNDPAARARITTIYRLIAKELKESFEAIENPNDKKRFAVTLASFLESIEKESNDAKTVLWAGSTLLGVAESLVDSGLSADARPLFRQSVSSLGRAEQLGFKGDPQQQAFEIEIKRQRALAQRGSGNFEASIDQFVEILSAGSALNIQIDACETLQMWAEATKRPLGYVEAIKGAHPVKDPKTNRTRKLIWGWEKLFKATRNRPDLADTYFLALYHVAECRLEYGILEKNQNAVNSAGVEIKNQRERDPTFGGEVWKAKFEKLEARVKAAQ